MSRAEVIKAKTPELVGLLRFYDASDDGPVRRKFIGWGCLAFVTLNHRAPPGWDCFPKFLDEGLSAGEEAELGFVFLSGETAAREFLAAGQMYLWEGRFIGEVTNLRKPE